MTWTVAVTLDSMNRVPVTERLKRFANLLEFCDLAVSNGSTGEGPPTSLQLNYRGYNEAKLVCIGRVYPAAMD